MREREGGLTRKVVFRFDRGRPENTFEKCHSVARSLVMIAHSSMSLIISSGWHDLQFVSLYDEVLQGSPVEDKVFGYGSCVRVLGSGLT
jgi:hypothetical protein